MDRIIELLKRIPIDLGQETVAETTQGKKIACGLVPEGKGRAALDVGARTGHQTQWLRELGYMVTPIDRYPCVKGVQAVDANIKLPFDDGIFDLVWCSEVIEHLDDPMFSLHEMIRVTRLGGDLILTTPNSYMWLFRAISLIGLTPQKIQRTDHLHFFDLDDIRSLAPDADLYGYFPWFLFKRTLRTDRLIGALSPTFVLHLQPRE